MSKLEDLIADATIRAPHAHGALSVFPLECPPKPNIPAYLVLDEAMASGQFSITEVSDEGVVPRLLAHNETGSPVFLLDGEELVGAKQDRVLNLSLMLAPESRTEIPVTCVESGRWRKDRDGFQATDRAQYCRSRAQKMDQVSCSLRATGEAASDQEGIWRSLAAKAKRMRVESPTRAMSAVFESRRNELPDYCNAVPAAAHQCGAIYALGRTIVGIEVFDTDATFRKLARKLVASYALDAMERDNSRDAPETRDVHAFLREVRAAPQHRLASAGIGQAVRLSSDAVVGAALEVGGSCVHLSAFTRRMLG